MNWKKRSASLLLAGCIVFSTVPMATAANVGASKSASASVASGTYEGFQWTLDSTGKLTITGKGAMPDVNAYPWEYPWEEYMDDISSLSMSEGITRVPERAFRMSSLVTVTLPSTVTEIGAEAFSEIQSLKKVVLPQGLKTIGDMAFDFCESLTDVTIPSSVNRVGYDAFTGSPWWESYCEKSGDFVRINNVLMEYWGEQKNVTVPSGITIIQEYCFAFNPELKSVVLPAGLKEIGNGAFMDCEQLSSITIPTSVEKIGVEAFDETPWWTNQCKTQGEFVCVNHILLAYQGKSSSVTVPSDITRIGPKAFDGNETITSVTLPDGVKAIDASAFAFSNLQKITLPASVETIGEAAFCACEFLKTIRFEGDLPEIGNAAFAPGVKITESWDGGGGGHLAKVVATAEYPSTWKSLPELDEEGLTYGGQITWKPYNASGKPDVCDLFSDIKPTNWFTPYVQFVYDRGLMSGTSADKFAPNTPLNRAMVAQILYSYANKPETEGTAPFTDVRASQWYYKAVNWAYANGVVSGLSADKFGPLNNVTREQLALMLYKYAGAPAVSGDLKAFADGAKVSSWAKNAMLWATQQGIISGSGDPIQLTPQGQATRAQAATMLMKFVQYQESKYGAAAPVCFFRWKNMV